MSSETEVLSFDEFLAERGYIRGYKHAYQTAYEYGEKSKQGEVDKLQTEVEELQKKIDLALEKCYTGIRKQGGDYYLELIQNVLKGE